jgi:hypothetical protein
MTQNSTLAHNVNSRSVLHQAGARGPDIPLQDASTLLSSLAHTVTRFLSAQSAAVNFKHSSIFEIGFEAIETSLPDNSSLAANLVRSCSTSAIMMMMSL